VTVSNPPIRRWVASGVIFGLCASSAFLILFLWGFRIFDSLLRVPSPGSAQVRLEPGDYWIYWEGLRVGPKRDRKPPAVPVVITPIEGGDALVLAYDTDFHFNYSTLDHSGAWMAEVNVARAGDYRVAVSVTAIKPPIPGGISIIPAPGVSGFLSVAAPPFTLFWGGVGIAFWILVRKPKQDAPK
jgi:hypothetical protein